MSRIASRAEIAHLVDTMGKLNAGIFQIGPDVTGGAARKACLEELRKIAVSIRRPLMLGALSSSQGDNPNPFTYQFEWMDRVAAEDESEDDVKARQRLRLRAADQRRGTSLRWRIRDGWPTTRHAGGCTDPVAYPFSTVRRSMSSSVSRSMSSCSSSWSRRQPSGEWAAEAKEAAISR